MQNADTEYPGFRIEMDFKSEGRTMSEVMEFMDRKNREDPSREYYMDGECYAIVSKLRCVA